MRFGSYILLLLCFGVIAYWMGVPSPFAAQWAAQGSNAMSFEDVLKTIAMSFMLNANILVAGLAGLILTLVATSLLSGYSAMYAIPVLILIAVANYFIFPLSPLFDVTIPEVIRIPLMFLFNMLMVLAIVDFVRGKT